MKLTDVSIMFLTLKLKIEERRMANFIREMKCFFIIIIL